MYKTGPYCIAERGKKDIEINLELLRAWGAANQATIEQFNILQQADK